MRHELSVAAGHGDVIAIEHDAALGGKLLQEEVRGVAPEGVVREIEVHLFDLVAIDAGVALKVVVAGFEREQRGALATAHIGDVAQSLAHVAGKGDIAALKLAPDELHAVALAGLLVAAHLVNDLVAMHADDAATRLHEHVARLAVTVDHQGLVPHGVAGDVDGVAAVAQVMNLEVLVIERVVALDLVIDDLVVLDIDALVNIGGVKADVHAAGGYLVDVELVAAQVEIARDATVFALLVVGEQREHHAAVGLGVLFVFPFVAAIIELVVLDIDVGAAGFAADVFAGVINDAVKDGQRLILAVLVELVVLDLDVVHLAAYPQASARLAVVVVGNGAVRYRDVGAHTQVEVSDLCIVHITVHVVDVHAVGMINLHSIALDVLALLSPPEALVLLEPDSEVADVNSDGTLERAGDAEVGVVGEGPEAATVTAVVKQDRRQTSAGALDDGVALQADGAAHGVGALAEVEHHHVVTGGLAASVTQLLRQVALDGVDVDVDGTCVSCHGRQAAHHEHQTVFSKPFHSHHIIFTIRPVHKGNVYS